MKQSVSKLPPSDGNRARLVSDGELLFTEMRAAIESASRRVWVETFIIEKDSVGMGVVELLARAAERGCDVRLMFDQPGSPGFNLGYYQPILDAGGKVAIFNPLPLWRRRGRRVNSYFRYRDHRKVFVADGIAFTGGHNLSEDYLGPAPRRFYDLSVKLEGPCVDDLARVFADSYCIATGEEMQVEDLADEVGGPARVQVFGYDASRKMRDLDEAVELAMREAGKSVTMIVAYFVPDEWLCNLLVDTARRGVDVKLLTVGHTDMPFVRWAGEYRYDPLLEAGVEIFQLEGRQLHAKCITIDGKLSFVGSYDFNSYQRRMNPEVAVAVWDGELAERLEGEFRFNLARSRPIDPEAWRSRGRMGRALEWASFQAMNL